MECGKERGEKNHATSECRETNGGRVYLRVYGVPFAQLVVPNIVGPGVFYMNTKL